MHIISIVPARTSITYVVDQTLACLVQVGTPRCGVCRPSEAQGGTSACISRV